MTKVTGYKPTPEQVEAAKARREAQQAEKAARKNKAGSKTVKSKDGTYKSVTVTPKQVEAKQKQRIAQKLKEEQHFGGKTVFDKKTGKYISQSAADVREAAENITKNTSKKSGFLSKLGKFGKKAGKYGLIGLGVAALVSGGIYLYNKATGSDNTSKNANLETKPEEEITPTPPEETTPTEPEASKEYTVVKGDNVWNIAKQHLKDLNSDPNYKPTDAEILKHTKELMELNQLEFEPDGYHVLIKPNDTLKLVA